VIIATRSSIAPAGGVVVSNPTSASSNNTVSMTGGDFTRLIRKPP
jgi:hypothetical protein